MSVTATVPSTLPKANDPCWCGSGRKYKRCHKKSEGRVLRGAVTPIRSVPDHIVRPPYADTGDVVPWDEPRIKSPDTIERMRHAGKVAAEVLRLAGEMVAPGVTTEEIDVRVHDLFVERGAYPSTINYHGYPKACCTSVNEVICHGIPDSTVLADGDIVNIDITAFVTIDGIGVHGDTDATYPVGEVDEESRLLVERTEQALMRAIAAVRPGRRLNIVGRVIESYARRFGYGVVRDFTGHGVHTSFHSGLVVPHYDDPRADLILAPGMTFTIEPMLNLGTADWTMWDDGWTVVTADLRRSAQFEHTLVVTDDGAEILTLP